MTTFHPPGIRRFLAVLILLFIAISAHALEQMQNASFTSSFSGWTIATSTTSLTVFTSCLSGSSAPAPFAFSIGSETAESLLLVGRNDTNSTEAGNATVSQSLPYYSGSIHSLASAANAEILLYYKVNVNPNAYAWSANIYSDIYCPKTDTKIIEQNFYNVTGNTAATFTAWCSTGTANALLAAGASYTMRLRYSISVPKRPSAGASGSIGIWVDQVSVNISPQGLIATETSDGRAQLTWSASTCPPNVPSLSTATHSYRIYRSTSSGGPWTLASSTSSTTWSEEPSADKLYYCITDVDTTGRESPKSVEAVFKRPRLRITTVEAPTTVGRGQTGIPVKIHISNEGEVAGYFGGASLTFSPGYGDYSWSLLSPAIGTTITAGASITAEFKVDILETSECNEDTIDATASETRDAGACSVGDAGADTPAHWLIRPIASLKVSSIVTPSVVYRAQANVPIDITVVNDGGTNAQGYWDSTTLKFSTNCLISRKTIMQHILHEILENIGQPSLVFSGFPA